MKILLFHNTTDSDLYKGLQVCYKDIDGQFTKLGVIIEIMTIMYPIQYLLEGATGAYTADELKLTETPAPEYLGVYTYPNAFMYADNTREENGDYKTIAAVYFRPLELRIFSKLPRYKDAIEIATAEYNKILRNIETPIVVSGCGQTITARL